MRPIIVLAAALAVVPLSTLTAADLNLQSADKQALASAIRSAGRDCTKIKTVYVEDADDENEVRLEVYCPDSDGDRATGLEHYLVKIDRNGAVSVQNYR